LSVAILSLNITKIDLLYGGPFSLKKIIYKEKKTSNINDLALSISLKTLNENFYQKHVIFLHFLAFAIFDYKNFFNFCVNMYL